MSIDLFPNDAVTCITPWYEIRINSDGTVTYCQSVLTAKDPRPSNFIQWFQQGDLISNARTSIQTGNKVSGCNKCYANEQKGYLSFRNRSNHKAAIYDNFFKESLKQSPAYRQLTDISIDQLPSFIHVSLNNLCNLGCRMCSPYNSSKVGQIFYKAGLSENKNFFHDWTDDPQLWDSFIDLILKNDNLKSLHFMGGEPLLHKKFRQLLDIFIKSNKTNFDLTFVTNGMFLDAKLIEVLHQFDSVQIEISIENFHNTNDYVREGSDYSQIQHNIESILPLIDDKFTVVLRTVFQALTALHYNTLLAFAVKHRLNVDNNILSNPRFLHAVVLPGALKQQIVKKLEKFKKAHLPDNTVSDVLAIRNKTEYLADIKRVTDQVIAVCSEPEPDNVNWLRSEFVKFNSKIDQVTGSQFVEHYPELADFFSQYHNLT
jgi:pyruvate-formate lyase-activating enzyme